MNKKEKKLENMDEQDLVAWLVQETRSSNVKHLMRDLHGKQIARLSPNALSTSIRADAERSNISAVTSAAVLDCLEKAKTNTCRWTTAETEDVS